MVGVALLVCRYGEKEVAEDKPSTEESTKLDPIRKVSINELEKRDKNWYFKGETEPFTGTAIECREDGSKFSETS